MFAATQLCGFMSGLVTYVAGSDISQATGTKFYYNDDSSTTTAATHDAAKAFDGNTTTYTQNGVFTTLWCKLGVDYGAGSEKRVWSATYTGQAAQGVTDNGAVACSLDLIGSNTAVGSDEVTLATDSFTNSAGITRTLTASDHITPYRFIYFKITKNNSSGSVYCAEMTIKEAVPG